MVSTNAPTPVAATSTKINLSMRSRPSPDARGDPCARDRELGTALLGNPRVATVTELVRQTWTWRAVMPGFAAASHPERDGQPSAVVAVTEPGASQRLERQLEAPHGHSPDGIPSVITLMSSSTHRGNAASCVFGVLCALSFMTVARQPSRCQTPRALGSVPRMIPLLPASARAHPVMPNLTHGGPDFDLCHVLSWSTR